MLEEDVVTVEIQKNGGRKGFVAIIVSTIILK